VETFNTCTSSDMLGDTHVQTTSSLIENVNTTRAFRVCRGDNLTIQLNAESLSIIRYRAVPYRALLPDLIRRYSRDAR